MYDLELEIRLNVRHGVRNKKEINDFEQEIRSKCTTWNKKFDRNVRHAVRNKYEMKDLE